MYKQLYKVLLPVAAIMGAAAAMQPDAQQILASPQAKDDDFTILVNDKPSLSDLLTVSRTLDMFYDYLRESTGLVGVFLSRRARIADRQSCCQVERLANPLTTTTIFAPKDAAIISLSRKPHQGPPEDNKDWEELSAEDEEKSRLEYLQV